MKRFHVAVGQMTEKLLDVKGVARRINRAVGTTQNLMMDRNFPPPRVYGRFGRKLYAAEDIDFWLEKRRKERRT